MGTKLHIIHDYLMSIGMTMRELEHYDTQSVYLAMEIMEYAHLGQK